MKHPTRERLAEWLAGMNAAWQRRLKRNTVRDPQLCALRDQLVAMPVKELLARPLNECRFVVLDTETTGFHAYSGDELLSVAMLELVGLEYTGRAYQTLIKPNQPIPASASAVHGISDDDVRDSPGIDQVLPDMLEFMDRAVLVGHHINFDIRFINRVLLPRLQIRLPHPWLDTMLLYLAVSGRLGHYSLEEVAAASQVRVVGRHTADGDARTAADIFLCLAPRLVDLRTSLAELQERQFQAGEESLAP